MYASDLMTTDLVCIGPSHTIREAAELMLEHRVSALPVVDGQNRLLGMLREGDLVRRVELGTERRRSSLAQFFTDPATLADEFVHTHAMRVGDVMTKSVPTAAPDTPLADIADLMQERQIRRVPIVEDGKLVGLLSRRDLVRALLEATARPHEAGLGDRTIQDAICSEIRRQPWANLADFNVSVVAGTVRMAGIATTEAQHKALLVLAQTIPGVRAVEDRINVAPVTASAGF